MARWSIPGLCICASATVALIVLGQGCLSSNAVAVSREFVDIDVTAMSADTIGTQLAKHEPKEGCILGAYIDLDPTIKDIFRDEVGRTRKLPRAFEQTVGRKHGMYFFYLGYGYEPPRDWIRRLAEEDRFVHIALEPNDGLDMVQDDAYLENLADKLNATGARIFLRFASEMNGPWVRYHGSPKQYIEKFRMVTEVFRRRAPKVAMVWCPYTTPRRPIKDYYPGDNWVDWVGVNMYNVTYFDQNPKKPAKHVTPQDMLKYVYENFSERKPIMIGEYATTHYSPLEDKAYPEWAAQNISSLYRSIRTDYPRVKAINYFNCNNLLLSHRRNNNYLVQELPTVLDAYREAIKSPYFIANASDVPVRPSIDADIRVTKGMLFESPAFVTARLPVGTDTRRIRFLLDGDVIHTASARAVASVTLEPGSFQPGRRVLRVEALDGSNRLVGAKDISVRIAPPQASQTVDPVQ